MAEHNRIARRSFFTGLGLAAAAAGVATLAAKLTPHSSPGTPDAAASPEKGSDGDSYRLTEHIKKYYRSTTI